MSKKYTIEIDANVKGDKEVKKLSQNLEDVSKASNDAATSVSNLNEETQQAAETQDEYAESAGGASEESKDLATSLGMGAAKAYIFRSAIAKFVGLLPVIATAFAVITAAVLAYRAALKSVDDYTKSSVETQKNLERLAFVTRAWDNAWKDLSITIGEFFSKFRDAWVWLKEGVKAFILIKHGQEDYLFSALAVNSAVENLTWNYNEMMKQIQELNYVSEDQKRIMDDTSNSLTDRMAALDKWKKTQEEILDIELKILRQEKLINKDKRERGIEEENELAEIEKKIRENERARENLTYDIEKMSKAILHNIDALEMENEQLDVSKDIAEAYFKILEEGLKKAEKAQSDYNDAISESFDYEEEDIEDPEFEDLMKRIQYQKDYEEYLGESLNVMGGMWGDYFINLKSLYDKDVKFTDLSNESKISIISQAAQATLGIANQLLSQLAASASEDFETQKKYKIAAATISTLQGMVQAFTGAMQLGPIAGPIVGGILAAATAAMGFANIAKIKQTKPDSAVGSGDVGSGGGASAQVNSAPSFSLVNPMTSGETKLSTQLEEQGAEPTKAYVVSSDVSSQQSLDRKISDQASI